MSPLLRCPFCNVDDVSGLAARRVGVRGERKLRLDVAHESGRLCQGFFDLRPAHATSYLDGWEPYLPKKEEPR